MTERRTKADVLSELEALMREYLTAESDRTGNVMVTGFVFQVSGRHFHADGEVTRLHGWGCPEDQETYMTLGLAHGLAKNADSWYADVMGYGEVDDDDE
jgi:hypothetical protein